MPALGPLEILVVAVVALIVFGPEKLPDIARTLGRAAAEMRRMAAEFKDEFDTALDLDEEDEAADAPTSSTGHGASGRGADSPRPGGAPGTRDTPSEPEPPALEEVREAGRERGSGDEGTPPLSAPGRSEGGP